MPYETWSDNYQVEVPSVCQQVCQVPSKLESKYRTQLKRQRNFRAPSQVRQQLICQIDPIRDPRGFPRDMSSTMPAREPKNNQAQLQDLEIQVDTQVEVPVNSQPRILPKCESPIHPVFQVKLRPKILPMGQINFHITSQATLWFNPQVYIQLVIPEPCQLTNQVKTPETIQDQNQISSKGSKRQH